MQKKISKLFTSHDKKLMIIVKLHLRLNMMEKDVFRKYRKETVNRSIRIYINKIKKQNYI